MSDEVSDFLRSVELLKGRREEEDEARSRELEQKILQEKKERQARRAERARSISPQKSSPVNTPSPTSKRISLAPAADGIALSSPSFDRIATGSPRARTVLLADATAMDSAPDDSTSPTKENHSPFDSDAKRTSLPYASPSSAVPSSRSPLSWQRRPRSHTTERPKSRPLSVVAAENAASRTSYFPEHMSAAEPDLTRDQIAQSLAGKDPSWFKQTADRGENSAAFRRNQVEDSDTLDMSALRTQLPGMSRQTPDEPSKEMATSRPESPSPALKLGPPLPLTSGPRLDPPTKEAPEETEMPPLQRQPTGRTSPTRPASPTKGMGGFVQSAMMKRSDSVKRWSVTSPGGLQRADSSSSVSRNSVDVPQRTTPGLSPRPHSMLRDESFSIPRPISSHGKEADIQATPTPKVAEIHDEPEQTTPPASPSKTMDPRRWSPTKSSSWLEAALNKPDSPKPKPTPPTSHQPAWMVELNKAKAQKAGVTTGELDRNPTISKKHEVKTGGLMRSSPMGTNVKPTGLGVYPVALTSDKLPTTDLRGELRPPSRRGSEDQDSGSQASGNESAGTTKTKPDSAPKKDFRTNLKPRVPPPSTGSSRPPEELKNLFENLRRTKTQSYKAPDELKSNILRGKAALNSTGGPQKGDKKDEFKEAILKKKEDFQKAQQEGRGVTRAPSSVSESSIPEGLAKKMEISRSGTISRPASAASDSPVESPNLPASNRSSAFSTISKRESSAVPAQVAPRFAPKVEKEHIPAATRQPMPLKETSAPGRLQTKVGGGLADRFNPALAGLLARGPPVVSGPSNNAETPSVGSSVTASEGEPAGPGPQLTHITKNRARGPKRKAPTSIARPEDVTNESVSVATPPLQQKPIAAPQTEKPVLAPKPVSPPIAEKPVLAPKPDVISLVDSRRSVHARQQSQSARDVITLVDSSTRKSVEELKPTGQPIALVDSSAPKTRPRSPTKVHEQVAALAALASKPADPSTDPVSAPSSPRKLDLKRMSQFLDNQGPVSPKPEPEKSLPPSPIKSRFPELVGRSSPPKPIAKDDPFVSAKRTSALLSGVTSGLSQMTAPKPMPVAEGQPKVEPKAELERPPQVPPKGARPLPAPPRDSGAKTPPRRASPTPRSPAKSPTKYGVEVATILSEFFGTDRPQHRYTADASQILLSRPSIGAPIRTQSVQLFQISDSGRKTPVPAHNERVLFEREMYLCPHTFTTNAGKKVKELYFWAGDEVPESTAEDNHLFASREARAYGGKLVKLTQGKETPEFLQALGGIAIIRRGSSNRYDSLASNMLCGRRYLGQIVFDEVDFAPSSLCSGFPYLINQQGKCYLWKGKGSDVDELSCARLVGMDLALMGELSEVEEGLEPANFWDVFGGATREPSADHWRLKPNYPRYAGRLFVANGVDDGRDAQITEIFPFRQTDLLPSNIYILDAFFEMYIIVGARSQHQYAAFRNALDFANDYAMASWAEDRPFNPISTVVLEGIPRDLKSVFRKWLDRWSPTIMNTGSSSAKPWSPPNSGGSFGGFGSLGGNVVGNAGRGSNPVSPNPSQSSGGLRRGRSLRIVPLTQALLALKNQQ